MIDVQVFTREGVERGPARAARSRRRSSTQFRKDLNDEYRIVENATFARLRSQLVGKQGRRAARA